MPTTPRERLARVLGGSPAPGAFSTQLSVSSRDQPRRGGRTAASRQRSSDIRAWARQQGLSVSERGRIPASVVQQYEAAAKDR